MSVHPPAVLRADVIMHFTVFQVRDEPDLGS